VSDFLNEVADYLAASSPTPDAGTVATDIFIGQLPASPDSCVAIFGLPAGALPLGSRQVSTLWFPRFQVVVRNQDYDTASAKLQDVRTKLHAKYGLILPNWRILAIHADSEGGPIGTDDQNRFEFAINFSAEINAEVAAA
jgi:hypothetical protein